MRHRTQWYLVLFGIAALLVSLLVFAFLIARPLQIAWHRSAMEKAYHRMETVRVTEERGGTSLDNRSVEKFEWHRDQLVELGALLRQEYHFRHVLAPTPQSRVLFKSLLDHQGPPVVYWSSPHFPTPTRLHLIVWCWPDDVLDWDAFIETADKPADNSSPLE